MEEGERLDETTWRTFLLGNSASVRWNGKRQHRERQHQPFDCPSERLLQHHDEGQSPEPIVFAFQFK